MKRRITLSFMTLALGLTGVSLLTALFVLIGSGSGNVAQLKSVASQQVAEALHQSMSHISPAHAQALGSGVSIADVAEQVSPSVVSVFSEKEIKVPDMMRGPFFFRFFGPGQKGPNGEMPKQKALGSGVIIDSDGIILTNNHVVAGADSVRVGFTDGQDYEAEVIGTDPKSDIAVIKIKKKNLEAIKIADSSKSRVGDLVLAIGNPFGLSHSVTMGIISATGRADMGIAEYENFIQTDAAINPGNSGGALVNMKGELVGINTAIVSRSGGSQGIGFAIPSTMAMAVQKAIRTHGRVIRGWLGVAIQELTTELADNMKLKRHQGVLVADVEEDSPADKGGLKRGDVILSVDGQKTTSTGVLRNKIAVKGKGAKVALKILRDGKKRNLKITLGELPETSRENARGEVKIQQLSGLHISKLNKRDRNRLQIPRRIKGVLVSSIDPSSPAQSYGLQVGDVIVEVNRRSTGSIKAFNKAMRLGKKRLLFLVYREGHTIFLAVQR